MSVFWETILVLHTGWILVLLKKRKKNGLFEFETCLRGDGSSAMLLCNEPDIKVLSCFNARNRLYRRQKNISCSHLQN